jgi:hypothetical protein
MSGGFQTIPELANAHDIGTSLTTMGTETTNGLNTPGAWAQLIAATPYDCVGFDISLFPSLTSSTSVAWDIGIGPSGSEHVIADKLVCSSDLEGSNILVYSMPIAIPAGTHVAVRSTRDGGR